MNKEFYAGNRKSLYQKLEAGSLVVVFSGHAPIKTNDENYPFFTNRNFLYLTGIEQENIVLMAYVGEGTIEETLYLLPPDAFAERWTGRRIKEEEAEELSGITNSNMWQHSGMIFPDNYFLAMLRKFILILTRFMKIRRQ